MFGKPAIFLLVLLCLSFGDARADIVPQLDLDALRAREDIAPTRLRWMMRPEDPAATLARVQAGVGDVELVGRISRFDDLWILEGPADSAAVIVAAFGAENGFRQDRSGEPALLETTALVGVREGVWSGLDLHGDRTSTVAILDSGVDTAHDDLGDLDVDDQDAPPLAGDSDDWSPKGTLFPAENDYRVVAWHDVTDDLPLAVGPWDYHFHGTAIAGAGFGGGDLEPDFRGVAPSGRLAIVKTWNFEDRWERWASDLLLGFDWLLANHQNLEVRACLVGTVWDEDLGFEDAVQQLREAGIVVIAPTGNHAGAMGWPARIDGVLAVGATTSDGRLASYSSVVPAGIPADRLDLLAPGGSAIDELDLVTVPDNEPNDSYRGRFGTSIAAAHVAGAVSVMSEALLEVGRPWRDDEAQVQWLTDVFRATAVEVAGAETGAAGIPFEDRMGPDPYEGYGLLQVRAALDAVLNVLWMGEDDSVVMGSEPGQAGSWAARVPVSLQTAVRVVLEPEPTLDADLFVYRERSDGLQLIGWGINAGEGVREEVRIPATLPGHLIIVARYVSGVGTARISSAQEFEGGHYWPLETSSPLQSPPTVYDLDDDGSPEIIALSNLANTPTGHRFQAWNADGSTFGLFPRTYFSPGLEGELTAPAVGSIGDARCIVAGSSFGLVYCVDALGDKVWEAVAAVGSATTSPTIYREGADARILVGTNLGVVVLDAEGTIVRTIAVGGAVRLPLAVGDLDSDGVDEVVAVNASGDVYAFELEGTFLDGWPRTVGTGAGPPVLLGDSDGQGAHSVVLLRRNASVSVSLVVLDRSGVPAPASPKLVATRGSFLHAVSPLALFEADRSTPADVVFSTVSGGFFDDLFLELHRISLQDLVQETSVFDFGRRHLDGSLLWSSLQQLAEPLVLDVGGVVGRDVLQASRLGWEEQFLGSTARYGGTDRLMVWPAIDASRPGDVALTGGHELVASMTVLMPTAADLDGDNRPELIVPRRDRIHLLKGLVAQDLNGAWTTTRHDGRRRACHGCGRALVVAAPVEPRGFDLVATPNPFNPSTELTVEVPRPGRLEWSLFDLRGRRLRGWTSSVQEAGVVQHRFEGVDDEGRPLASGVYVVRVSLGSEVRTARLVLIR